MICLKCKKEIEDDSRYCLYCGNAVETLSEDENPYIDKMRKSFIIGFVGIDLALSIITSLLQIPNLWVFGISAAFYLVCIGYGVKALNWIKNRRRNRKKADCFISTILIMSGAVVILVLNGISIINFINN